MDVARAVDDRVLEGNVMTGVDEECGSIARGESDEGGGIGVVEGGKGGGIGVVEGDEGGGIGVVEGAAGRRSGGVDDEGGREGGIVEDDVGGGEDVLWIEIVEEVVVACRILAICRMLWTSGYLVTVCDGEEYAALVGLIFSISAMVQCCPETSPPWKHKPLVFPQTSMKESGPTLAFVNLNEPSLCGARVHCCPSASPAGLRRGVVELPTTEISSIMPSPR